MLSLTLKDITVSYSGLAAPVLSVPRLQVDAGESIAVTGASGSGKSTFVNLISGLEPVRTGQVEWSGTDLVRLAEHRRDRWRGEHVGLVMQDFHLFPGLSALDNVLLPARLAAQASAAVKRRARDLLAEMGLDRPGQVVETMSRGEMQRVAIARALVRGPGVVIADEPTASLDRESGQVIADLLIGLAGAAGATLIVVSHDPGLIARLPRRITLESGQIAQDSRAVTP
ncbi:putative ABC transport system ATP-binding protein [Rhizobium sp. PP-F2F-G48]|uniref:ABC transporter ATP-binding protein n=1 Tax=Rhizobium sp. PP-F2F-G48 TaxID=2135651 RepID=UPI00104E9F27|nr:ATP-binding cassette domain-containing protein [Rhizobium sp. PP-F2F-G48]TCM52239.1 putative ABC transport system ATP-binding protein [Rhizobium sp. PP-F2F-G48]